MRLWLERTDGDGLIEAETSRERCGTLELRVGEVVFARPRAARVFAESSTRPLLTLPFRGVVAVA